MTQRSPLVRSFCERDRFDAPAVVWRRVIFWRRLEDNGGNSRPLSALIGSASLAYSSEESLHRASSRLRAQPMACLRQH